MNSFQDVLKFWFCDDLSLVKNDDYEHKPSLWFQIKWETDELIKKKFTELLTKAENDQLNDWLNRLEGRLAYIILLDQFSMNIYRGTHKMFANNSKAVDVSLNLINDIENFKNLSTIEKYFVYLPLIHSENADLAKLAVEGMKPLVNESKLQKGKFIKYEKAIRDQYDILVKYGRYPHRNELLKRESTREEKEFLQRNKHGFVKSVRPATSKHDTFETDPDDQVQNKASKKEKMPFQNILFLHGYRQSSNKVKKRLTLLLRKLKLECNAHVTFLNGTHPYKSKSIGSKLMSRDELDTLNSIESQRVWYETDENGNVYEGMEESISYVIMHIKLKGPYDGVIGFSQGACLASIIVKRYPTLFRYFISISGYKPNALTYRDMYSPETPYDFPSLHIIGKTDTFVEVSRCKDFAKCFTQSQLVEHEGGHFVPGFWHSKELIEFIKHQALNQQPSQFVSNESFELKTLKLNEAILRFDLDSLDLKSLLKTDWAKQVFASSEFQIFFDSDSTLSDEFNANKNILAYVTDKLHLIHILFIKNKKRSEEEKSRLSEIVQLLVNLYLENDNESLRNYLLTDVLEVLFVHYENWKELVAFCDKCYSLSNKLDNAKQSQFLKSIYEQLIELFSNQLLHDLKVIDLKNNSFLVQELTSHAKSDESNGELNLTDNQTDENSFVSELAKYLPRVKSAIDNNSRIARECANKLNPYKSIQQDSSSDEAVKRKILSYNHYRKVLSCINHFNEDVKSVFSDRNPKYYLGRAKYDKKVMEYLLKAPLSDAIINPVPEPVDVSSYDFMKPLYDWLAQSFDFDATDLKFLRGTVTSDGRLDLCKQVVGPQGIQPLLDSLQHNQNINRLLLGNNIIGDQGGKVIADFIKSGKSKLIIWYIAGNRLTSVGIKPITEALLNDTQVKALWLKRNPLKAEGMVHIGKLLRCNQTIEVLDLLNCGLLDEGVKILFESLRENNTIKHLYLSANGITSVGLEYIKEYFKTGNSNLKTLFLGSNRIGNEGAKIISELLTYDRKLLRLNLSSSRIGAEGMMHLAKSLETHPSLMVLDLGYTRSTLDLGELGNYIEDEGAFYLSKLLEKSTNLLTLNITNNHITAKGMEMIVKSLKSNRNLIQLEYSQYGVHLKESLVAELRSYLDRNRQEMQLSRPDFDPETIMIPDHVKEIYSVYRTH